MCSGINPTAAGVSPLPITDKRVWLIVHGYRTRFFFLQPAKDPFFWFFFSTRHVQTRRLHVCLERIQDNQNPTPDDLAPEGETNIIIIIPSRNIDCQFSKHLQ